MLLSAVLAALAVDRPVISVDPSLSLCSHSPVCWLVIRWVPQIRWPLNSRTHHRIRFSDRPTQLFNVASHSAHRIITRHFCVVLLSISLNPSYPQPAQSRRFWPSPAFKFIFHRMHDRMAEVLKLERLNSIAPWSFIASFSISCHQLCLFACTKRMPTNNYKAPHDDGRDYVKLI